MLKWDHEVLFVFGQNQQGQDRYERFMTRVGNDLTDKTISNLEWVHPVPDSIESDETRQEWVEDNVGFTESSITSVSNYAGIQQFKLHFQSDGDAVALFEFLADWYHVRVEVESTSYYNDRYAATVLTDEACFRSEENARKTDKLIRTWRNKRWREPIRSRKDAIIAQWDNILELERRYDAVKGEDDESNN